MLGSPSFEPEPAGWAEYDGHEPETSTGEGLVDVEIDWHLAHFERTGSRLPDGVVDELTREARELLYLEWQVLEPERARIDHDGGRAAVSPNTVLRTREEVAWFRHLLDQLWLERSISRPDRRRSIIDAVRAEAESLRQELADGDPGVDPSVFESVVDRYATLLSSRADDRADHTEVDRTVRELTDKLRLLVGTAVLTDAPGAVARLTHHAQRHDSVRAAWSACAHDDVPAPSLTDGPSVEFAPELFGRDPLRHLKLMLDPVGPVDARPVPIELSSALRTPNEGSALRTAVEQEFRRATCPAGLADPALRARWFLAVLYAGSCWTAATLTARVQQLADPDPATALRRLIRAEPAPHTIDRVRGAALLQTGVVPGPVEPDGWRPSVAGIAFDGARSSRFAIPADVALEVAPIDTCGVRLRGYLGDDRANRAARFGEIGIEQLCELIIARFHRKIHQRLLKDDQLTTGSLRDSTPTQWHAVTTKQMRREAFTVLKRFRAGRPIIDDVPEPEPPELDEFEVVAGTLDPDVLVLLMAGPRASGILRDVTERWLAARHSRVGTAMDRRLAGLLRFRVWFDDEVRRAGSTAAATEPILRRTEAPLRHALHHFVLAGGHRPNGQGATTDDGPAPSDQAATRAAQRASEGMFKAVITMLIDLDLLPDRGGVTT